MATGQLHSMLTKTKGDVRALEKELAEATRKQREDLATLQGRLDELGNQSAERQAEFDQNLTDHSGELQSTSQKMEDVERETASLVNEAAQERKAELEEDKQAGLIRYSAAQRALLDRLDSFKVKQGVQNAANVKAKHYLIRKDLRLGGHLRAVERYKERQSKILARLKASSSALTGKLQDLQAEMGRCGCQMTGQSPSSLASTSSASVDTSEGESGDGADLEEAESDEDEEVDTDTEPSTDTPFQGK